MWRSRLAVLMGENNQTCKFALASSLMEHAERGRSGCIPELSGSYA
jgi:hypothetical protein